METNTRRVDAERELVFPASMNSLAPVIVPDLIRVGGVNDGGYVIPEHLIREAEILVSMGVNEDWSFDEEFKRLNPAVQIHAYDHTISRGTFRRRIVKSLLEACAGICSFSEVKKRRLTSLSYERFFRGTVQHFQQRIYDRHDFPFDTTLDEVFARTSSDKVFLKIDIEGSEYRIIDDVLRHSDRISGMVIEFHDTGPFRPVFLSSVERLQSKFDVVHLHGNNAVGIAADQVPDVLEVTFERRTSQSTGPRRTILPIPSIDAPNVPLWPDYSIRFAL